MLGGAKLQTETQKFPSTETVARALVWAALYAEELSTWIKYDERALAGELPLRSPWIALSALTALYPRAALGTLGVMVGLGKVQTARLHSARHARDWVESQREAVIKHIAENHAPPPGATTSLYMALAGLIRERGR